MAAKGRIDSIVNIQKIEGEFKIINQNIDSLLQKLEQIAVKTAGVKINFGDAKDMNQLIESIKKLNELQDKAAKTSSTLTAEQKKAQAAAAALDKQRQQGLAQMAKQEAKERDLQAAILKEIKSIDDLKAQTNAMIRVRSRLDQSTVAGKKQFEEFTNKIRANTDELKRQDKQIGYSQRNVGNYASAFRGLLGAFGITAGLTGLVTLFKGLGKTVSDFSSAGSKLASVLGTTKMGIGLLTIDALRLGATTKFTATEVTNLQIELAKLGKTKTEIKTMTKDVLNLAAATGAELGPAAKVTGVALGAFGLAATDSARVTSVLAVATARSALSFGDYETILSTVGPVAKAYGFTLEDTIALTGKLKDAGFDASKGATAARNIILNLADANGKLAKALGRPVTSLEDLVDGMQELQAKGIDLNTMLELTDKRSVAAFATFLAGGRSVLELKKSITGVEKELTSMVKVMEDNLSGDKLIFKSAWDGLILSMESGKGPISAAARGLTQMGTAFLNLITPITKVSDEMESQRGRVNSLVLALQDSNTNDELRIRYYDELKTLAPEVVAGIDMENLSMIKLNKNLAEYNKQQLNKILLQRGQEDIDEALNKEADAFENIAEKELSTAKLTNNLWNELVASGGKSKDFAINEKAFYLAGKTSLREYSQALAELAEREKIGRKEASILAMSLLNYDKALSDYNATSQESISLAQKRADLAKRLGIQLDVASAPTSGGKGGQSGGDGKNGGAGPETDEGEDELTEEQLKEKKKQDALAAQRAAAADKAKKALKEALQQSLQTEIEIGNIRLQLAEKNSFDEYFARVNLLEAQKQLELNKAEETGIDKSLIEQKYAKLSNETLLAFTTARMDKESKLAVDNIARQQGEETTALNAALAAKNITVEEYEKQRNEIENKYKVAGYQNAVDFAAKEIEALKAAGLDVTSAEKKLFDAEIALDDFKTQTYIGNRAKEVEATKITADKKLELEKDLNDRLIDLGQELFTTARAFSDAGFEAEAQKLDAEKEQDDIDKEAELLRAGKNERKKDEINAKYAAREKQRQTEVKRMQTEKARADKLFGVFQVAINTGISISKTMAELGLPAAIPFIAIAAGIGALQMAAIAAQPIPKYAKGRSGGPAEFAFVGEEGQEAINYQGKTMITPGVQTLTYLPAGASVIPNRELMRRPEMFIGDRIDYMPQLSDAGMQIEFEALRADFAFLSNVIQNKKEFHLNITERGIWASAQRGASVSEYINKNIRL